MGRLPAVTAALLITNVAVFVIGLVVPAWRAEFLTTGAFWFPTHDNFRAWQVVSYMFLHADVGHILLNMFALVSFGTLLERQWGATRFAVFYFACGIGAALVQMGVDWREYAVLHDRLVSLGMTPADVRQVLVAGSANFPLPAGARELLVELYRIRATPMLGASGAIYGVLVAFGVMYPNAKLALIFLPVPIAAKFFIPILLGLDLLSGITGFSLFGAGVAHFAHVGGGVIGFLLMLLWRRRPAAAAPHRGVTAS